MWLRVSCELEFDIAAPMPFILMLRPRSGAQQWVAREEYNLSPNVSVMEFTDGYGNLCQRLIAPQGRFRVATCAEVKTADAADQGQGEPFVEIQNLPNDVLGYLLPSRYCESECFHQMASEITYGCWAGYDQVAAIVDWLRENIHYRPGSSDTAVSAVIVNQNGYGVCRDLAHLGISLCRSLCIPARMVVGYLHKLDPMDLHAWFEAYVGGRWYTFDAVGDASPGGYVAVGYGRDAADVAIYNQYGPPSFPLKTCVSVEAFTPSQQRKIGNGPST